MLEFLRSGGSFVYPMLLLALVVSVLTVRGALRLFREPAAPGPRAEAELHAILFWGVICAILGYLGQAVGVYNALLAISRARELSPAVIAQGYAQSFTTVILGLVVLVGAAVAWFVLYARLRRIASRATA
jgi:hypothetical protein